MPTEWRTPEIAERLVRRRQQAMGVMSVLVSVFVVDDLLTGGANVGRLVVIRACWAISLAIVSARLVPSSVTGRRQLLRLAAIVSSGCFSAQAMVRGDQQTAYFAFHLALPLCSAVVLQDEVGATVMAAATTVLGACAILFLSSSPALHTIEWIVCLVASASIAIYASIHQRAQLHEEAIQQQRLGTSERARAKAERLALVGQLAAGVAHEINNPLAFIKSNLSFVGEELAPGESELRTAIEEAHVGLERIRAIVGDLTAFSREGSELTTAIDLHAIVEEAQRMASMRTRGRCEVVNRLPADLPQVLGNQRHLCQVFLNLIINAADELGTAATPNGTIWVQASASGKTLHVDVDDNGPGIPASVLPGLFTPFFTTKPVGKGTGLGLATSREYLRRAGGDLLASARPGGGARFTLTLPLAPAPA